MKDAQFIRAIEAKEFPAEQFDHQAHIRLAWILIAQNGIEEAIKKVSELLREYVIALGAQDKYHHTLTVAAVKTVYHFYQKSTTTSFQSFIAEYPQLLSDFRALLDFHYSKDILFSEVAKEIYLAPDLAPFS